MRPALLVLVLALPLAAPAVAMHDDCDDFTYVTLTVPAGEGTLYVDQRSHQENPVDHSVWLYEETNGVPGLQRGGASDVVPDDRDFCIDDPTIDADHLIAWSAIRP